MDEGSLEAAIEVYKGQLRQVEAALGAEVEAQAQAQAEAEAQADLQRLRADLQQLVALTESSLLSVRKSRLLEQLEPAHDDEYAAFQAAVGGGEPAADEERAMKPCPYYLTGTCRFLDSCRYSHGEVVAISELREFEELDLSSLEVGSPCLAKFEDDIWYPAKILDIDNGYFTVKFDSLLQREIVVEGDGIMPVHRSDESSSSSSSEDEGQLGFAKVLDAKPGEMENWTASSSSSFAGWEAHTRGMGSKLMMKMGYEFGKGLGKNAEGRVEPVHAVVLPQGKSLDQCTEILQKKREGKLNHLHKKKHKRKGQGGSCIKERKARQNVFDFLNDKLQSTGQTSSSSAQSELAKRNSKECYRASNSMKKTLNVQLFQIMQKIDHTEKDIARIMEALARNVGRDKAVTSHLEEKLSNARKQLSYLKTQESGATREQKKGNTHKMMTKF